MNVLHSFVVNISLASENIPNVVEILFATFESKPAIDDVKYLSFAERFAFLFDMMGIKSVEEY